MHRARDVQENPWAQPAELASSTFRERSCLSKYGEDLSRKYPVSDFGLHIHVGRHAGTSPYMYIHTHAQSPHSQNKPFWWETRAIECCVCFVCNGRSSNSRSRNESCRTDYLGNDRCSHCRCLRRVTHVCPDVNSVWERMLKWKGGCPHGRAPDLPAFTVASVQTMQGCLWRSVWHSRSPDHRTATVLIVVNHSLLSGAFLERTIYGESMTEKGKGSNRRKNKMRRPPPWRIWRRGSSSHTLTMKQSLRTNDLGWYQPLLNMGTCRTSKDFKDNSYLPLPQDQMSSWY